MQNIRNFFIRKKIIWIICYPLSLFCLWIVKNNTYIAEEIFAKKLFKFISQTVSAVTRLLPFSLAELLIVTMPIILSAVFVLWLIKVIRCKEMRGYKIADGVLNVIIAAGIFTLMFVLGCGVNYYRYPFSHYAELTVGESSKEELYELCLSLAEKTNDVREELSPFCEDKQGVYELPISIKELGVRTQKAFKTLSIDYPVFSGYYPAPKSVYFSRTLSKMGITGIFIPFTMEANVNIDISDYSIASTMCHELAHLHGFIREDEANYIAYLACINSGDLDLEYSGLLEALIISGNALYQKDKELYYSLRETYSEAVIRDLTENSKYWIQFEDSKLNEVAEKVNDTYLKANNQSDGVQSYGRMVDLLLAEYRKSN